MFSKLYINDSLNANYTKYETPLEFWKSDYRRENKNRKLLLGTMFSLFPVVSLFLVLSLGVVHSRHQKSYLYLYLFLGILFYFVPTLALQKSLHFITIPIVLIPWIVATFFIYRKRIAARF